MNQIIIYIALTLSGLVGLAQSVGFDVYSEDAFSLSIEAELDQNNGDDDKPEGITASGTVLFVSAPSSQILSEFPQSPPRRHSASYAIRAPPCLV